MQPYDTVYISNYKFTFIRWSSFFTYGYIIGHIDILGDRDVSFFVIFLYVLDDNNKGRPHETYIQ
jgi:hypothetical protein